MLLGLIFALAPELTAVSCGEAGWNQWTSGSGSVGAVAVAIDPVTPAIIYVATALDVGAVLKSTDGGTHWNPSSAGLTAPHITALAVDAQSPTTVYAGTSGFDVWGVFKSTDGGAHWTASNVGFPPATDNLASTVSVLVADPQTAATLYAGTNVGVFKSTDAGGVWSPSSTGLTDLGIAALAIDPQRPATLYTATTVGVFKSTDGGAHWSPSSTGLPQVVISPPPTFVASVFSLAVSPRNSETVYAGTVAGVFKSTDGGAHWNPSNAGLVEVGLGISAIVFDPQTPATLYAATFGAGVFRSPDGGQSWAPFNAGLADGELFVSALQVSPSGGCLHAVGQFGVLDLVVRPDPCASVVNASASVNASSFSVGQTVVGGIGLLNVGGSGTVDIYVGILMPDLRTVAFFASTADIALGDLGDPASFRPIATEVPLSMAFAAMAPSLFSYQWNGDEPRGGYLLFILAVRAGALIDGAVTDGEILAVATAPFSFP